MHPRLALADVVHHDDVAADEVAPVLIHGHLRHADDLVLGTSGRGASPAAPHRAGQNKTTKKGLRTPERRRPGGDGEIVMINTGISVWLARLLRIHMTRTSSVATSMIRTSIRSIISMGILIIHRISIDNVFRVASSVIIIITSNSSSIGSINISVVYAQYYQ